MKIKIMQLRQLIKEEISRADLVHEAVRQKGRFTRQQMIGKVSRLSGDKILRYVRSTRDSKGNFLNVYEVESAETGRAEMDMVHPSDQTEEWYIDDGPEAEEIKRKERKERTLFRARETQEQRWRDKIVSMIRGAVGGRLVGKQAGPYITVRNGKDLVPELQRILGDVAVVEPDTEIFSGDAKISPPKGWGAR